MKEHKWPAAARGPPAHVTFTACCLLFFVTIIFLHNHSSMAYVHSTIITSFEAPAGWLQSTSRTTVRAVTIKNAAGEAVTRAAVTATTTTTTLATAAASSSSSSSRGSRWRRGIISRWPQHNHPGAAQLAAAPTAEGGQAAVQDIELHPQRVAQVVQQLKESEQDGETTQPTTAAEQYADLYSAGAAGSVVFEAPPDMHSCPAGTPPVAQGATAVMLLADSSSGASVLKRSLDGLMLLYSQAKPSIRSAFHLFIGLEGGDEDMRQLAHQYAQDSLGALKLVHHHTSSSGHKEHQRPEDTSGSFEGVVGVVQASSSAAARADHVRLMLHVALDCFDYPSVLLLEDDWKLLPDYFEYFAAAQWLLDSDPTLSCISAWNPLAQQPDQQDHQHSQSNLGRLQRVDTNPGRGWLMSRATGLQLLHTWPHQGHDMDWQQHVCAMGLQHGQQCVVPDVPRMLPAALHDVAEAAHIVEQPGGDSGPLTGGDAAGVPAGSQSSSSDGSSDGIMRVSDRASGRDDGYDGDSVEHSGSDVGDVDPSGLPGDIAVLDPDAESTPGAASAPEGDAPAANQAANQAADQAADQAASHGTDTGSPVVGASMQQQQQEEHVEAEESVWAGRDLSHLMAAEYKQWLEELLLQATTVDVATAAQLTANDQAVLVLYSSAADLTAAAEALGVPLTVTQGVRYCYNLPSLPPVQHCQDYLPDMAYEGVVTAHTRAGVRLYFVHLAYSHALQARQATQAASTETTAPVATA